MLLSMNKLLTRENLAKRRDVSDLDAYFAVRLGASITYYWGVLWHGEPGIH